jgi:hypothetical protein
MLPSFSFFVLFYAISSTTLFKSSIESAFIRLSCIARISVTACNSSAVIGVSASGEIYSDKISCSASGMSIESKISFRLVIPSSYSSFTSSADSKIFSMASKSN